MAYRNRSIPRREHAIVWWVRGFANHVVLDPIAYGFTADDAALLERLSDELTQAFIAAHKSGERTTMSVVAKNECMKRVLKVFRSYKRQAASNPDLTPMKKTALGIVTPQHRVSALPAPERGPSLGCEYAGLNVHRLRYRAFESRRRGKPRGVTHLILLCAVDDGPESDPQRAQFVGCYTRGPITIRHDDHANGKMATYFAAWLTRSGELSPWTTSTPMVVVTTGAPPLFKEFGQCPRRAAMPRFAA
jgi:hypothetical protein